MVDVEGPSS